MFIVLLTFSDNRDQVSKHLDGHKAWIKQGFDDGVFLVAGRLQPELGGALIAHSATQAEIESRVAKDPFVAENVVTAEILEIAPAMTDDRLKFLLDQPGA